MVVVCSWENKRVDKNAGLEYNNHRSKPPGQTYLEAAIHVAAFLK